MCQSLFEAFGGEVVEEVDDQENVHRCALAAGLGEELVPRVLQ
jgi:hypothetical protein